MGDLIRNYWREVGVDMSYQLVANTLFFERADANEIDVAMYSGEAGLLDSIYYPKWYFPEGGGSYFGLQWALWYTTGGADGEEPPPPQRRQMELYDEIKRTVDFDQQRELFMELLAITRDEFYVIGTVRPTNKYAVVQNAMKNVMNDMPETGIYPDPAPSGPEQYYFTS